MAQAALELSGHPGGQGIRAVRASGRSGHPAVRQLTDRIVPEQSAEVEITASMLAERQ